MRSNNPKDHPIIQPNYFEEKEDLDVFIEAFKKSEKYMIQILLKNISILKNGLEKKFNLMKKFQNLFVILAKLFIILVVHVKWDQKKMKWQLLIMS